MNDKTEELRDLFMDITDESTITEQQEEGRGSLSSDEKVDERLADVVASMRERYEFSTTLPDEDLVTVVRGYYEDSSDEEIARELGDAALAKTVSHARLDLQLLREEDRDASFDLAALRTLVARDATVEACADELGVDEATVRRYRRIVEVENEIRRVNGRYTDEFENVLYDRELSDRMTQEIQQDGLEDATEGMETNVSF